MKLKIELNENIKSISTPENMDIGMKILNQHRKCSCLNCGFDYYAFALGQSPFPVPETLKSALARNAGEGQYSEADGILELRESIDSFNKKHFNLDLDIDRVIVGPGTHTLLFMIFSIVDAKPIIPTPTWIGYNPMLDFLGKKYIKYPLHPENDYKIEPDALSEFLSKSEENHILVINNPHNPSGAFYSKSELESIVEVCRKYGTLIVADEIYALTTHDFDEFTSLAGIYPEGAFVTNGISKDRSAGGYRLGSCIVPKQESSELRDAFATVASSLYSNVATPIQLAAVSVYNENPEIEEYFNITREINRLIGLKISEKCNEIEGLKATVPYGGFYFILDFNQISEKLKKSGIENSNQLSEALLEHPHHIATLTGDALLVSQEDYIARIAFVDYDGGKAFKDYKRTPPKNQSEQDAFVEKHAAHMLEGVRAIEKFVKNIGEGF